MNEKGWRYASYGTLAVLIMLIILFIYRMIAGHLDIWTIMCYVLIPALAVAYGGIRFILKMQQRKHIKKTIAIKVSNTKTFVLLFISLLLLIASAVGIIFFSKKVAGTILGIELFGYLGLSVIFKLIDIWRLSRAQNKKVTLLNNHNFKHLSQAEKVGLVISLIGLIMGFFTPVMTFITYLGLLVFLIRPLKQKATGGIIDIILVAINLIMIGISILIVFIK